MGTEGSMPDQFVSYTIILERSGALSPAEDLETAIIAAAHAQALGQSVIRIHRNGKAVLEGRVLKEAIAKRARDAEHR
jgi:hypothetical protein